MIDKAQFEKDNTGLVEAIKNLKKEERDTLFSIIRKYENQMAEDGRLHEAIEESLTKPKFDYLKDLLQEYGISNKRYKEILKAIEEDLEMNKNNFIEYIDEGVSRLFLNNEVDSVEDLELIDPEAFYCKYFE